MTDGSGLISDPDTVCVNLLENQAPVASAGGARRTVRQRQRHPHRAASSDIDSDPLTYAWQQVDPATDLPIDDEDPTKVAAEQPDLGRADPPPCTSRRPPR
ncbi:MAG: hypothetical protein R2702_06960 [Acidimicrobiales bacterium]